MESNLKYTDEWISLNNKGDYQLAEKLYFDKLFPEILDNFHEKYNHLFGTNEVLISMLGFSPEPIILTAYAMKPVKHYIITTEQKEEVIARIKDFIDHDFNLIILENISFNTIYKSLKEIIYDTDSSEITVDITGGKKSMVAAAAIFGKDYRCKITYVDFGEYIRELRKPKPGSEILDVIYDPNKDQPEIYIK